MKWSFIILFICVLFWLLTALQNEYQYESSGQFQTDVYHTVHNN